MQKVFGTLIVHNLSLCWESGMRKLEWIYPDFSILDANIIYSLICVFEKFLNIWNGFLN